MRHATKGILVLLFCGLIFTACVAQSTSSTADTVVPPSSETSSQPSSDASSLELEAVATVERIDLAHTEYSGAVGDRLDLTPVVYPTTAADITLTYASSDEAVVTVDENGSCILVGAGTAEIIVTDTQTGVQTAMTITAKAAPEPAKPQPPPPAPLTPQQPPQTQAPAAQTPQPQAPAQAQKPQTQTPSLPEAGYYSDEELQKAAQDTYGMTVDEAAGLSDEEYNEIIGGLNWGF